MTLVIIGLVGFLLGGLSVRALMMLSRRHAMRMHELDSQYQGAKRAVERHLRVHGTLNLEQLERMLDISGVTAMRYLDQMVRDGLIKSQGHGAKKGTGTTRGKGAFYTHA